MDKRFSIKIRLLYSVKVAVTFLVLAIFSLKVQGNEHYCRIKGIILDQNSHDPLISANIFIKSLDDSSTVFLISDKLGWFYCDKISRGKAEIKVTHIGYETFKKVFNTDSKELDFGIIYLNPKVIQMPSVEVIVHVPMAIQNGDTIEYNANTIAISQNASAKDLIMRMSGFYENRGNIQINGENVETVLIEGNEYFKYTPNTTLETIPAEMIKKIQVYEKPSDVTEMTGIDDGNRKTVINIVLQPGKKNGLFGDIYSAYGQKDVYQLGATLNSFGNVNQFTVLVKMTNNINISDNSGQSIGKRTLNSEGGISKNQSGGINFNSKPNDKMKVSGSYTFNYTDNSNKSNLYRQYLLDSNNTQKYLKDNNTNILNARHNIVTRIEYNLSAKDNIIITSMIEHNNNEQHIFANARTFMNNSDLSRIENRNIIKINTLNIFGNIHYKHDFIKNKRSVIISFLGSNGNIENKNEQEYEIITAVDSTENDFRSHLNEDTHQISGNIHYQENLGLFGKFSLGARLVKNTADNTKYIYHYSNVSADYTDFDSSLSVDFNNEVLTRSFLASYRNTINKLKIDCQINYERLIIQNLYHIPYTANDKKSFFNWLPGFSFIYKFSKSNMLKFRYWTVNRIPFPNQLNEVLNNDNPENLKTGNADLTLQYDHRFRWQYKSRNKLKDRSLTATIVYSFSDTYIGIKTILAGVESEIYDGIEIPPGAQLTRPENMSGYATINSQISYGIPIKYIKSNLFFTARASITKTPGYLNEDRYLSKKTSGGALIVLTSNISKEISFKITNNVDISRFQYVHTTRNNTLLFYQCSSLDLEWNIGNGFDVQTDFSYIKHTTSTTETNNNSLLWNLSFGKKLFKNQQGDLRLYIYDILKDNKDISQYFTDTYIEKRKSLTLDRYLMLNFNYKIKNYPDNK